MGIYGKINILIVIFMICIILNICFVSGKSVPIKRHVSPDENEEHTDNSVDRIRYDEYPNALLTNGTKGGNGTPEVPVPPFVPLLVVPKRAAILLDRIMVALHHALEDGDQKEIRKISELYKDNHRYTGGRMHKIGQDFTLKFIPTSNEDVNNISDYLPAEMDLTDINNQENRLPDDMMGLQRRGNGESGLSPSKGRVYWRCYFNAVTCF